MITRLSLMMALFGTACDLDKDSPSADGDWNEDTAGGPPGDIFGGDSTGQAGGSGGSSGPSDTTGGGGSSGATNGTTDTTGGDEGGTETDGGGSGAETGGESTGSTTGEEETPMYALAVTPAFFDFGEVGVGSIDTASFLVQNTGSESVHVNGVAISDTTAFDVTMDFTVPFTFSPGMARSLSVSFEPGAAVNYEAEVTFITEELLEESADIPLSGRGEEPDCDICSPIIEVSPRELTIDALLTCSATESVTVRNEGDQPLVISAVNVINDSLAVCGTFTTSSGAMTVTPYGETAISVTYTASYECADLFTSGSEENTLRITSNDPVDPVSVVGLTGYATCLISF